MTMTNEEMMELLAVELHRRISILENLPSIQRELIDRIRGGPEDGFENDWIEIQ